VETLFGIAFTKLVVYFGEEISDLQLCCRHFSPTEISAYFKNFLVDQPTKVKPLFVWPITIRKAVGGVVLGMKVIRADWRIRENVLCCVERI
jgi:hypothetical protein